jgi:hypothetical protein
LLELSQVVVVFCRLWCHDELVLWYHDELVLCDGEQLMNLWCKKLCLSYVSRLWWYWSKHVLCIQMWECTECNCVWMCPEWWECTCEHVLCIQKQPHGAISSGNVSQ